MRDAAKEWTILIYANGNNELEPEMLESKLLAEKVGSDSNMNIIMELGRESRKLVQILRPNDYIPMDTNLWTGVRRYCILNSGSKLLQDLGKINMADYKNLYNFIYWGIKAYPARRYMLIISGHGSSFISVLTDFSQDEPYMMGVPEMCSVINSIIVDLKAQIDILVLDICFMNLIEIIYELGKEKNNTVKSLLTYIKTGPISGLPYDKLINSIKASNINDTIEALHKKIVDNISLNLVAIDIKHGILKKIKQLVNDMSYVCLTENYSESSLKNSFFPYYVNLPIFDAYNKELEKKLSSLVISSSSNFTGNLINLTFSGKHKLKDMSSVLHLYYKLSFSRNNYWSFLLANKKAGDKEVILSTPPSLYILPPRGLRNIILSMNPGLTESEISTIIDNLYSYKGWKKDLDIRLIDR